MHQTENKLICEICNKDFKVEQSLKRHMQSNHMLPKKEFHESVAKVEWKLAEAKQDGRFNCLDCNGTYPDRYAVTTLTITRGGIFDSDLQFLQRMYSVRILENAPLNR